MGLFRRRQPPAVTASAKTFTVASPRRGNWSLASSAYRVDAADKREAKVQRMLRQGWQSDAWNYRDSIGELRYAGEFLANCTARMRIFPAIYPIGGESDDPVALDKAPGIPSVILEQLVSVYAQAMLDLGDGREAISGFSHKISSNKTIAGEWYLLGRTDERTGAVEWSCRSVDELVVYDEVWSLREIPTTARTASSRGSRSTRSTGHQPRVDAAPPIRPVCRRAPEGDPRRARVAVDSAPRDPRDRPVAPGCQRAAVHPGGDVDQAADRRQRGSAGRRFPRRVYHGDDGADRRRGRRLRGRADRDPRARRPGKNIQHIDFTRKYDAQAATERSELLGVLATAASTFPKRSSSGWPT